jgi:hypothetical protein
MADRTMGGKPAEQGPPPTISAATWVLIATLAATLLLLYTGVTSGEWRGVVVTEVQIAVVGLATWLVVRGD